MTPPAEAAPATTLTSSATAFILHWGEMGTRWGVNRTVAQIHALLYLSPEPLTAEQIAELLAVARSNVSNSLRELQNWNLVHIQPRMGDRRDFFTTSHDVWQLFLTVVEQRVERELLPTLAMLKRCAVEAEKERPTDPTAQTRIAAMAAFINETVSWYSQMKTLPPATLRSIMRVGTKITHWLPGSRKARKTP
jgi:DNA-binding transcriptional regulator GbsR (MarR family)